MQRGMWHMWRRTKKDLEEALRLFELARNANPNLVQAYAAAAETHFFRYIAGHTGEDELTLNEGYSLARDAIDLDADDAYARYSLGRMLFLMR